MEPVLFNEAQIEELNHAVEVAEDLTANHYKISASEWRRMRYDIKTVADIHPDEITREAFAQVIKFSRSAEQMTRLDRGYDYYLICLQDHKILQAVEREPQLDLMSLLIYIVTHELVHVVRFFKFKSMFETPPHAREKEESVVHAVTYEILKSHKRTALQYILDSYAPFRKIDEVLV